MADLRRAAVVLLGAAACLYADIARAADPALIDAAKREGEVVWYTTQIINQLVRPAATAFEAKYGIKVRYVRANATETTVKILNESRAGRPQVDVFDGTTTVVPLKSEGFVLQWLPDAARNFPAAYRDPDGYWVATNLYVLTPGFNTSLVPQGGEPRTLAALLDPRWRGRMAWSAAASNSAGPGFIGTILRDMGDEKGMAYLHQLAQQRIANIGGAAREVLDQVIAGEYAIALQIFNHHAVISAKKGAPVGWIKMEPATVTLSVISVHKQAPHPNAGKLLVDFLTSPEGQEVFRAAEYLPADPHIAPLDPSLRPQDGKFRAVYFSPEQAAEGVPRWKKIFDELFR